MLAPGFQNRSEFSYISYFGNFIDKLQILKVLKIAILRRLMPLGTLKEFEKKALHFELSSNIILSLNDRDIST